MPAYNYTVTSTIDLQLLDSFWNPPEEFTMQEDFDIHDYYHQAEDALTVLLQHSISSFDLNDCGIDTNGILGDLVLISSNSGTLRVGDTALSVIVQWHSHDFDSHTSDYEAADAIWRTQMNDIAHRIGQQIAKINLISDEFEASCVLGVYGQS